RDRQIPRRSYLVSRQRRDIASVRDRVTLLGGLQSRHGALIALAGSDVTRAGRALADPLAYVVLSRITAGHQVLIAGGLITIGRYLVAVSARLVAVSARLIAVGARLIDIGQRLIAV
ncbi:MAG: hypothetical protein QOE31_2623, partial [Solirubrobacteraceae bacterium]|nr:hypothetical protein [Solirubrobacteraceae bacterium]